MLPLKLGKPSQTILIALTLTFASPLTQAEVSQKPKYGPEATPLSLSFDYFQNPTHSAHQFWNLIPYYLPQRQPNSCSVASVTMFMNAARAAQISHGGASLNSEDKLVTEEILLQKVQHPAWKTFLKQAGKGVTLDELGTLVEASLKAYGIPFKKIEVIHANQASEASRKKLHEVLVSFAGNKSQYLLGNFTQGVYTGDANVGHISPLAAYDTEKKRVLVLDSDREWYEPYWVSEETLFRGMATFDPQSNLNRGYVIINLNLGN